MFAYAPTVPASFYMDLGATTRGQPCMRTACWCKAFHEQDLQHFVAKAVCVLQDAWRSCSCMATS